MFTEPQLRGTLLLTEVGTSLLSLQPRADSSKSSSCYLWPWGDPECWCLWHQRIVKHLRRAWERMELRIPVEVVSGEDANTSAAFGPMHCPRGHWRVLLDLHLWLCHTLINDLLICDLIPNLHLHNYLPKGWACNMCLQEQETCLLNYHWGYSFYLGDRKGLGSFSWINEISEISADVWV